VTYHDLRGPLLRWLRPRGYRGELLVGPFAEYRPIPLLVRLAIWLS